ncbi:hypothetical protein [Aeromonas tecta]|uniref:hypothetical protein n=1 Tax=Aeromonas tecta TaxID=324617 RepID=UPI0018DCB6E8|nr:hypothetical protein [Aeromonas tecta]
MTDLRIVARSVGVDVRSCRMNGIERLESLNSKRKEFFNRSIINAFHPVLQTITPAAMLMRVSSSLDEVRIKRHDYDVRLLEVYYRPKGNLLTTAFYNSCDSISLIELTLLQLSDALLRALHEKATAIFFKVESRVLYALEESLIHFSSIFNTHGISLYIEIGGRVFISNNVSIHTLTRLCENNVNLVIENFLWRGGDWRERYISSGIFKCVKFDTPPQSKDEVNKFKDVLFYLKEKHEIDTIVSRVETKKQSEIVLSTGCWAVQGFYYARPKIEKLINLEAL